MSQSCVHVYTGNGKGKTCCAVGLALRAAGHQKRAVIVHFLKSPDSGEDLFIREADSPYLTVHSFEKKRDFYPFLSEDEQSQVKEEHEQALRQVREWMADGVFMVVLDEVLDSVGNGIICQETLHDIIDTARKNGVELVLTGRMPETLILDKIDYITRFENVRHPFENGTMARRGVEY